MQGRDRHEVHELDERLHVDLTSATEALEVPKPPALAMPSPLPTHVLVHGQW